MPRNYTTRKPPQVGERFPTKTYGDVVVIAYRHAKDVDVRFVDSGYVTNVAASTIRSGWITDEPT